MITPNKTTRPGSILMTSFSSAISASSPRGMGPLPLMHVRLLPLLLLPVRGTHKREVRGATRSHRMGSQRRQGNACPVIYGLTRAHDLREHRYSFIYQGHGTLYSRVATHSTVGIGCLY